MENQARIAMAQRYITQLEREIVMILRTSHRDRLVGEIKEDLSTIPLQAVAGASIGGAIGALAKLIFWVISGSTPISWVAAILYGATIGGTALAAHSACQGGQALWSLWDKRKRAIQRIYELNNEIVATRLAILSSESTLNEGLRLNFPLGEESDFVYDSTFDRDNYWVLMDHNQKMTPLSSKGHFEFLYGIAMGVEGERFRLPWKIPAVRLDDKIEELAGAIYIWRGIHGREENLPFQSIDLSDSALTWEGLHNLLALEIGRCDAVFLRLSGNDLSENVLRLLRKAICEENAFPHLERLDLSHNRLEGSYLPLIQDIATSRNLESLNLSHNKLGSVSLSPSVHEAIQSWGSEDLLVFSPEISTWIEDSTEPLSLFLKNMPTHIPTLRALELRDVGFQTRNHIEAAVSAISRLPFLQQVDLRGNWKFQDAIVFSLQSTKKTFTLEAIQVDKVCVSWVGAFLRLFEHAPSDRMIELLSIDDKARAEFKHQLSKWLPYLESNSVEADKVRDVYIELCRLLEEAEQSPSDPLCAFLLKNEEDRAQIMQVLSRWRRAAEEQLEQLALLEEKERNSVETSTISNAYADLCALLEQAERGQLPLVLTLLNAKRLQRECYPDEDIHDKLIDSLQPFSLNNGVINSMINSILTLRKKSIKGKGVVDKWLAMSQNEKTDFLNGPITEEEFVASLKKETTPFYEALLLQEKVAPVLFEHHASIQRAPLQSEKEQRAVLNRRRCASGS